MSEDIIKEFTIKNPRWMIYVCFILCAISLGGLITFIVLYCIGSVSLLMFILYVVIIFAPILIVSVFGIYSGFRAVLIFKEETFYVSKLFGRKLIKVEDLSCVNFYFSGFVKVKDYNYIKLFPKGHATIEMIDKEGKKLIKINDDFGVLLKDGLLGAVLAQRNIAINEHNL